MPANLERHSPNRLAIAGKTVLNNISIEPEAHVRHPMHCFLKFLLEIMKKLNCTKCARVLTTCCTAFRVYTALQPQHAVWGVTHAAGCTGSQGITGQNGRQEPRKENRKPTTGNCLLRSVTGQATTCLSATTAFTLPHWRKRHIDTAFKHPLKPTLNSSVNLPPQTSVKFLFC